jgi:hypothetical protein
VTGFSDYTAENVLAYVVGKTAVPTLPTAYIALFTTAPTSDAGTGGTEVSGGSYARVSTTGANWNAATASSGSEPSTTPAFISNNAAITFPTATASWGTIVAFGVYDAASSGNLLWWDYLGNFKWIPFTCTNASPGVLTVDAAGDVPTNGTSCVVTTKYGGTLPTTGGSWAGILTSAGSSGITFNLGVNTTSTGSGQFRQIVQQSIPNGVQASFAGGTPGQLVLTLA